MDEQLCELGFYGLAGHSESPRDLVTEAGDAERLGLAYLFVSHDLGLIRFVSDRVAVMYLGRLAEVGPGGERFKQPLHPYTQALLAAIPAVGDGTTSIFDNPARLLEGELPNPIDLPRGCRFASRCP